MTLAARFAATAAVAAAAASAAAAATASAAASVAASSATSFAASSTVEGRAQDASQKYFTSMRNSRLKQQIQNARRSTCLVMLMLVFVVVAFFMTFLLMKVKSKGGTGVSGQAVLEQ